MKTMRTLVEVLIGGTTFAFVLVYSMREAGEFGSSLNLDGTCVENMFGGVFTGSVLAAVVVFVYDFWKREVRRG